MEQGSEGQENNQKSITSSKSSGSLIRIDAISIDLFNDMDNHQDANQCDHFSLRGYVAAMRKKDISVCLPFCTDDKWNESEEENSILPPLDVVKSKRWSCFSCLHKIGAACCAEEIGKLSECSPSRFVSKDSCSITEPFNGEVREAHVNRDEVGPGQNGEVRGAHMNRDEVGPGQSLADGSGNDAYHQMGPLVKDIVNSQALVFPKTHAGGSDVVEFRRPSNFGHLENNGSNSAKIGQTGTSKLPNNQPMNIFNSEIMPKVSSWSTPNIEGTKGKESASQLLDDLSSESCDINPKGDNHDKLKDRSSKSVCQRAPKIRLLTELLGSGRNGEINQSRSTDSDSESASDFCDDMTVQALQKKHSNKGKRKITQEENGTPLSSPKKSKLSKGPANFAKRNCMVVDSNEECSGTFAQQKNLKNHLLSKKKHKPIQNDCETPSIMPRPDVAKKKQFAPTGGLSTPVPPMYSNTETDLYYKSSTSPQKSNLSKKKNKQVGVWQAVPVPQSSTMPGEGSSIRKDSDASGRKGVDLSLKSYGISHRNVESHTAKDMVGAELLLLPWNSTAKERCHQVKDTIHPRESIPKPAPDQGSGKGLLYDLNEKIPTHSSVGDMQNDGPRFGGSAQHHRDLNISSIRNNENNDEDRGNEDIPMDIVELMAKNQYDRRRHESEKVYFSPDYTNEKRTSESIGIPIAHGNGVLKSYQVVDHTVRKPPFAVKSNEHLGPVKANSINSFSDLSLTNLTMSKIEGKKTAFARYSSFFDHQGTQSGTMNYPESGSIRNSDYQNFQWKGDNIGSSYSPLAGRYSLAPSYTKFPQSYATQGINFVTNSQVLEAAGRGKQAKDLDLNFVNEKHNNFEKREKAFGFESFPKTSVVDPFASKHTGIDLNVDVSETLDLDCNETIPAMQLLSLMDAGMKSNPINHSAGNQNMILKPINACIYHPKVLEKPPFLSGYHYKEPFQHIGVSSNASRPTSSSSSGKNQWRDINSCECPAPIPTFGPFPSPFQNKGNFVRVENGLPTRVPSEFDGKRKGHAQLSNGKLQKPSQNSHDYNSMLGNQTGSQYMKETVVPALDIGNSEPCFVNRNPADFSIPEPGNKYMINGRDIKFGKKSSLKGKQSVANVEGRKRQRVKVPTTTKAQ